MALKQAEIITLAGLQHPTNPFSIFPASLATKAGGKPPETFVVTGQSILENGGFFLSFQCLFEMVVLYTIPGFSKHLTRKTRGLSLNQREISIGILEPEGEA